MTRLSVLIIACLCAISVAAQDNWTYDASWASTLYDTYKTQSPWNADGKLAITSSQADEAIQNIVFFFSADDKSRKEYTKRVLSHWRSNMGLKENEADLLQKLSSQIFNDSDEEILKTLNQLKAVNSNEALDVLLDESGASQLKSSAPKTKFEVNEVGVIMAGLWAGVITVSVLDIAKEIILNLVPGGKFLQSAMKTFFGSIVSAAGFVGKTIGKGVAIAVQFVGHTIKNLFKGKGKEKANKPKKKKPKSVIALPDGSGDCCGLPYPLF